MNIQDITFVLNGNQITVTLNNNGERLLDVLREKLGLTGTKEGCGVGECGACTVIMNNKAVNACLIPAARVNGAEILTIEGLSQGDPLHPLQNAFIEAGAVQCGFCTPGMLLSAKAFIDEHKNEKITRNMIRKSISGNLCRCTGYQKIVDAIMSYAKEFNNIGE